MIKKVLSWFCLMQIMIAFRLEVFILLDMIEKIISSDKKSREAVFKAQQLKVMSAQKINDTFDKKRNEYLERARINIKNSEKAERAKADEKIQQIGKAYGEISDRLDRIFSENCDEWVDAVVKRVVEG